MTASAGDHLAVYKDSRRVGDLTCDRNGSVIFRYDPSVLEDRTAAVSIRMPVRAAPYEHLDASACFENLLPEGDLRGLLATATKHDERDVVGLLGVVGGECAGALRLWPAGEEPPTFDCYDDCTVEDLTAALGIAAHRSRSVAAQRLSRASMSGAQDKLVLYRRPTTGGDEIVPPTYRIPQAGSATTVLLKRDRGNYPGLVQNEIAAMTLMEAAGVPTAPRTACRLDRTVYETARFDRVLQPDGSVVRIHAEDGCQVTGRPSRGKYATTGGPRPADLVHVLDRYAVNPADDIETLLRWIVANICIGNHDAHAKNISFLHTAEVNRLQLAPAYDVVCTMVYDNIDQEFAIRFGGAPTRAALTRRCLAKAAREFRIAERLARRLVADVADRVVEALPDAVGSAARIAGEHPTLDQMVEAIQTETNAVRQALL